MHDCCCACERVSGPCSLSSAAAVLRISCSNKDIILATQRETFACLPSGGLTADKRLRMQERGAFTLVLSGGSLLKAIGQLVGSPGVDFSKWHVFFVDERNVPHSHSDSNYKGADEALLSKVSCARRRPC